MSASTLKGMLDTFDVEQVGDGRFSGHSDAGGRDIIDGSQVLAQSVVAASKALPAKSVRSVRAVFFRPVRAEAGIDFEVDVLQDGRSFSTVVVTAGQGEKKCVTTTLLMDVAQDDLVRQEVIPPAVGPDGAIPYDMGMEGRQLRLVGVSDPNDPDEVGPPEMDAWLRYDLTPEREDLRKALVAHFTGHLSISTAMRPHKGVGTAMSHRTLSTGVLAISVSFHEPVAWDGWILYSHESVFAGAGVAYVRGTVRTEEGRPIASFTQDALLRRLDAAAAGVSEGGRL